MLLVPLFARERAITRSSWLPFMAAVAMHEHPQLVPGFVRVGDAAALLSVLPERVDKGRRAMGYLHLRTSACRLQTHRDKCRPFPRDPVGQPAIRPCSLSQTRM
jgi:hypothetical protein